MSQADAQGTHSISGTTTLVGIIGCPVSHSMSPCMHNAAFKSLGLDYCYVPLPVPVDPPAMLEHAIRGLKALGIRGCNVTVPHKEGVLPLLDWVSPTASAIGAVNTIWRDDSGRMCGDNTDAQGFLNALQEEHVSTQGAQILIIGAGGSARAVAVGLAQSGCASITIANRSLPRAVKLAESCKKLFPNVAWSNVAFSELAKHVYNAQLIVNCTSLGMKSNKTLDAWPSDLSFRRGQAVADLVYAPLHTELLLAARQQGADTIHGLGMLLHQGALSFARWTGTQAPIHAMRTALHLQQQRNTNHP